MLPRARPNSITNKALSYFVEERFGEKTHICKIEGCSKRLNGGKTHNLVAHIKSVHHDIYKKYIRPELDESYYKKIRLELLQNLSDIVTVSGRPFSYLNDSGFLKIIQEKLDELKNAGHGIELHSNNYEEIKNYIQLVTDKINNRIKMELNGRYFAIMLDIAKKNNKSFLGISAQYIFNGCITIRSLGMKQIKGAQTAQNIKTILNDCLSKFGVTLQQVISITTDNGSNLLAMVKMINDEELAVLDIDEDSQEDDEGTSTIQGNELVQANDETANSVS